MKRRIIVCGSRDFNDKKTVFDMLDVLRETFREYPADDEIVTGGARGADALAAAYAKEYGLGLTVFPADWKRYGKAAGPIRNREMLDYAMQTVKPLVIAFWNGRSRGTAQMLELAKRNGLTYMTVSMKTEIVEEYEEYEQDGGIENECDVRGSK
jgi:hypothetical protein